MRREIEFLIKYKHPFMIGFIEAFPLPGDKYFRTCIVMLYADAGDLQKRVVKFIDTDNRPFNENQCLLWFTHVALALTFIHHRGFLHRDIKLQNILLMGEVINGLAQLGDFGFVGQCTPDLT
jgi:serine/threonine protein kinase